MKIKNRIKTRILALTATAWLVFALVECPVVGANDYCADNKAYPPFLVSAGVTPNLLMLIDNSASMNDLAYVGDQGYCYDNTYSSSSGYAGNFEPTTWYYWYGPYNNFYTIANSTAASLCSAADYYNTDVCVDFTSTSDFNFFTAKGNFLNWVAASKLDIQKEILTGGKYDGSSLRLLGESRGCLNRRFVKEVTVRDSGGTTYDLTLAVRPPDASEKESGTDAATRIELYGVDGTGGFDNTNCQLALEELQKDSPNQGQLKQYIEDCMLYSQGQSRGFSNYMAAFNHSIHNCWYYQKHGFWPPGNGPVQSIMPACESVYTDDQYGSDPPDITTDDRGYVCYGDYDTGAGYVGRCWDPSLVTYKTNGNLDTPGWTSDECIEQALMDYCGILTVPDVVDPSDQSAITGEFWNIPAVLIDSGVVAQLNEPKEVMATNIYIGANAPSGLIQEFTQDLRMGAMVFNDDGSKSECSMTDPHILYACNDAGNKDGGRVISYIDSGTTHTTDLVNAINGIQATSWTPLAETMYNAIGYYTQNSTMRLDAADFLVGAQYDPVLAYCQDNNILIITEGASTADQASAVSTFALSSGQNDGSDSDPPSGCSDMNGSTFLDDLTWYANNGTDIYPSEPYDEDKHNITTHIVVAGTLRSTGSDECSPDVLLTNAAANGGTTLYQATNPTELEDKLRTVFNEIRAGTSSGSAASVISSSRGGEGAVYQAIFWPSLDRVDHDPVQWVGEVHALLVDTFGDMYEDTNSNHTLDTGDTKVVIYYDESAKQTKACSQSLAADGSCPGTAKNLDDVRYLWSATKWLSEIADADIVSNRTTYISSEKKRYIFTWDDLNDDGAVDSGEVIPFVTRADWTPSSLAVAATRGPVPLDFGVQTSAEVNAIVNWVRGLDQVGMRSRQMEADFSHTGTDVTITWRLGDVIHSTPMSVSSPSEGYHYLYRDGSYGQFVSHYNNRRHMIYYGGNDGMLHAANGGFFNELQHKFCRTADCTAESAAPELGAEMWAYVPYNVLPLLNCLTDDDYEHGYYVDLRPRMFDVQVFNPNDGVHIGGWGTVLVAGMRLGGVRLAANTLDLNKDGNPDYPTDDRTFISAYMILDVTNPEAPPTLMAEMTFTGTEANMGYTTVIPTAVPMKNTTSSNWYLILGSGPTTKDARSTQTAKVAVVPFSRFSGSTPGHFRIPNALPTSTDEMGVFTLTSSANGFVSDPITVDFELQTDYMADVLYFGTVEGDWNGWTGKVYRLVTRLLDGGGDQTPTSPSQWAGLLTTNPVLLLDPAQPVTAAPAVAQDGDLYWVYFGTGRFLDTNDKADTAQQSYYGIKEPLDCNGEFTWATVEKTGTANGTPGDQGLFRVDTVKVEVAAAPAYAVLGCEGGGTACLPTGVTTLDGLEAYIRGAGCTAADSTGTDGWYRNFSLARERNVGQATVLGGLLTYTTYQPYDDICKPEGLGYLYGLYYTTGTAWSRPVFTNESAGVTGVDASDNTVVEVVELGRGLAKTPNLHVGRREGVKAFVQTSTGAIMEIPQENLPLNNSKSGRINWREVTE